MRAMIVLAGFGLALAGCGKAAENDAANNMPAVSNDASANASAPAGFRPPTVTSRAEYGGQIERRFHKLDKNGDDKLEASELPDRMQRVITRYDKDGDGSLNSAEWGALMLERFDRQDLNHDGSLTSEERQQARAQRDARRGAAAGDAGDDQAD